MEAISEKCQKGDKKHVQCLEPQLLSVIVQSLVAWVTCPVFVHPAFALTSLGVDSSLVGQCGNLL
jgi:hypothetical protein